ncbi:hypothetical protein IFM89_026427 [Coptis chinensis]|uniref:Uncharacterized protein n=1 Tax=Coptis chinensis TaxID=261450 RepID=A0A835HMU0_9MAGN|nr:hypothetical protein IFM89_026427 [Coptis chinensis]
MMKSIVFIPWCTCNARLFNLGLFWDSAQVFLESLSEGVATSHLDRRDEDYKEDRTKRVSLYLCNSEQHCGTPVADFGSATIAFEYLGFYIVLLFSVQARPDTIAPLAGRGFGALMEKKIDLIDAIIEEHAELFEAINEIVEKKKAMKKKEAMDESQAMVESR